MQDFTRSILYVGLLPMTEEIPARFEKHEIHFTFLQRLFIVIVSIYNPKSKTAVNSRKIKSTSYKN